MQLEISRRLETQKRTIRSFEQLVIEIPKTNLGQGFAKGRFCHKIKLCEVRAISKKSSLFFQRRREGPSLSRIPSIRRNRAAASESLQDYIPFICHFFTQKIFLENIFTPKKRVIYDKIHSKLPIFCVITAKYTVNCQFFALNL